MKNINHSFPFKGIYHNLPPLKKIILALYCIFLATIHFTTAQDIKELYKQGQIDYNNVRYKEAIENFTKVIELDSTHINAYLQRGFCKNLVEDFAGAISDFTTVISLDPNHRWAYVSRGSAKNKTGDYQSAIDDFNTALEFDATDQEAYNNRGFSKKLLGDKKGACEDWNTSKKLGNEEAKIILKNNYCK